MQNAPRGEHSAILSTFIKLPFVIKVIVLSVFERPLKSGFTVLENSSLTLSVLAATLSSADNFCKQFGPRTGQTEYLSNLDPNSLRF